MATLAAWLRDDPELRFRTRVWLEGPKAEPDDMGSGFDAVSLVLDHGFDLANLAHALGSWRRSCRACSDVTIVRDGVSVVVSNRDLDQVDKVVAALGESA